MIRRRLLILATLIVVGVLIAAVLWRQAPPNARKAGPPDRLYVLNVVNSTIPAWRSADELLRKMATVTPGLRTEFGGPTDGDANKQIAQLDTLIQRGVKGIIICPADPKTLREVVDRASSQGIAVVTMFGDVDGSARLTAITAAEELSAYNLATKVIAERRWDDGPPASVPVMILITKPGLPFADQRLAGLQRAFAEHRAIRVARVASNEWSEKRGSEEVAAALRIVPSLAAVFGTDSRAAVGAVTALQEARKAKGSIAITGWDSDEDTLRLVADGWVDVTSAPNMNAMTQVAASLLEAYNLGYLYPASLSLQEHQVAPLPDHIDIMQTLIDRRNVQAFISAKPHQ